VGPLLCPSRNTDTWRAPAERSPAPPAVYDARTGHGSNPIKVLSVVGNRPQFIKSAPLSVAFRDAGIEEVVLHTGQHYDRELSAVFFEELDLPAPAHRLDLHTADPDAMRMPIVAVFERERPDWALVYGDTNSTLAGALAARDAQVPLAHVEAGLRSGDLSMPEERNRIEVDRIAALLFCPDERSSNTLDAEGVRGRREVVGDVMYDACLTLAPIARARSTALERFVVEPGRYLLATVHREANVQPERLARIVAGLNRLDEPIVFPAHPRTRAVISGIGPHVRLIEPLGYLDLAALAQGARVILTDSGGLQKEAYWYGVPCVTLRPSTEWVDTVEVGANVLVDDDPDAIQAAVARAAMPESRPQLYGDGRASERIARLIASESPVSVAG
jgi:UDP-GlcNAc3NAcA epimerase